MWASSAKATPTTDSCFLAFDVGISPVSATAEAKCTEEASQPRCLLRGTSTSPAPSEDHEEQHRELRLFWFCRGPEGIDSFRPETVTHPRLPPPGSAAAAPHSSAARGCPSPSEKAKPPLRYRRGSLLLGNPNLYPQPALRNRLRHRLRQRTAPTPVGVQRRVTVA